MWRTGVFVAVGVLVAGCAGTPTEWTGITELTGPDVATLEVTGRDTVDAEGQVSLSPDGERLLTIRSMCVTGLDGAGERCVDLERVAADGHRSSWSPDGTTLAFSDDFYRHLREPDIWVFDVTSGDLRNLTDDGVESMDLGAPDGNADIDVLPSWSPDGSAVRFARGEPRSDRTELMSVGVDGGEPDTLREIPCGLTGLSALAWSQRRVAWTCGTPEAEVWLADLDGGEAERVVAGGGEGRREDRTLLSFSADGAWLLVDSAAWYTTYSPDSGGLAVAVPVEGGDPVPVANGRVAHPVWSPVGHALAYVELPGSLKVVAEPGGEPRELDSFTRGAAVDGLRLNWAPGKLLMLVDGEPTLLTLSD